MLPGRELIRATLPYMREQSLRSWWHLLSTGTLLAACLTASALPFLPWLVRLAFGLLSGLMTCRLFIIYHDYQHGTILRGSRVANVLMTAYGIYTLNPPSTWNASHNHHHKHVGKIRGASIGSFPVMTIEAYRAASRRERYFYFIATLIGYDDPNAKIRMTKQSPACILGLERIDQHAGQIFALH